MSSFADYSRENFEYTKANFSTFGPENEVRYETKEDSQKDEH